MVVFEKTPQRGIYQDADERKTDEYLHKVDKECYERMELLAIQMKVGAGITKELQVSIR